MIDGKDCKSTSRLEMHRLSIRRAAAGPARAVHSQRLRPMPLFYSPGFTVIMRGGGSFPMERYALIRAVAGEKLPPEAVEFCEPPMALDSEIGLAHDAGYLRALFSGGLSKEALARVGLGSWTAEWATRTRLIAGATVSASRYALSSFRTPDPSHPDGPWHGPGGVACVAAGGMHHAFPAHGEGYCFVNDLAVAALAVLADPALRVRRVGVLDVDVHQGNGTAACLASEPRAITVSVHGARNYPWASRYAGSYDIDVPDGATDAVYLGAVVEALDTFSGLALAASADPAGLLRVQRANRTAARRAGFGDKVLPPVPTSEEARSDPLLAAVVAADPGAAQDVAREAARAWAAGRSLPPEHPPCVPAPTLPPAWNVRAGIDLLLLQMGVDSLEGDRLGRLHVSRAGLLERNRLIFDWAERRGVPVCVTLGGGYGRDLRASAEAHVDVFRLAAESHARRQREWTQGRSSLPVNSMGASTHGRR